MGNRQVKIGCIGAGFALEGMYGPILKYMEIGKLEAVADRDPARLEWAREAFGIARTHESADAMLAEKDIEAVIVAVPIQLHEDLVVKTARAGKHVFCEKPMGRNLEECDRMIDACRKNKVQLSVGFQKRFNKSMKVAKGIIERGEIGDVFLVEAKWSRPFPVASKERVAVEEHVGWRHNADTQGGIFQDMGSHTVDLCRWWLGEVSDVSAELAIVDKQEETEDTVVAVCRHTNGAIAMHWIAYVHETPIEEYRVHGTKGTLSVSIDRSHIWTTQDPFAVQVHRGGDTIEIVTPPNLLNLDDELRASAQYLGELENFAKCIRDGTPVSPSGEDAKKTAEVVSAAYLSWSTGKRIALPLTQKVDAMAVLKDLKSREASRR